ncbi:MAG: histidinol-phosphatase HisJ family protein [Odoribacter sp.]|nr:histidinol-phosphatase HisJ family protein [Odoribacter sp.]
MIPLKDIITSTRNYNFHSHTQFCDGHDSMEAIAEAAVEAGFVHLGFSPHAPVNILSPCNMSCDDVPHYFDEVRRLDCVLPINVYAGMEIDFLDRDRGPAGSYYRDLNLDFSIGSVHFIPDRRGQYVDIDGSADRFARYMHDVFNDDLDYVVKKFYEQSARMIDAGGFDILGHFDKIAQNASIYHPELEQEGWYRDELDRYIGMIIDSGVIVEINTKARERLGRFFPHESCWHRLVSAGVPLMVNSDVHHAALVNASRDIAFEKLIGYGYAV